MSESAGGALSEYYTLLKEMAPLVVITASLAFTVGLHYIRRSYLQRTFWQTFVNLIFSSLITATMTVGVVCLSEFLFPVMSAKIEIGIAIFVGLFGVKGVDAFLRKRFNLAIVDLMNPEEYSALSNAVVEKKESATAAEPEEPKKAEPETPEKPKE